MTKEATTRLPRMDTAWCLTSVLMLVVLVCVMGQHKVYADNGESRGSAVRVVKQPGGWGLTRNGEPYFVKGAGGTEFYDVLACIGGNSVRTWSAEQAQPILDRAHEQGLTVTVGFWFGHERHGFNYSDKAAVAEQLEKTLQFIRLNQDHPAVLFWSFGNEAEGDGNNPLIWQAINEAAKAAKQIDPNHPTMTVISEASPNKIKNLLTYCPDIDVLGVNSYGGFSTLGIRLAEAGLDRPYLVTEYGPLGQWEVDKTDWGAPYEQTSSEKAEFCAEGYRKTILGDRRNCLGGYLFHWGYKQEVTPTWYGLFIRDTHETTEVVDVMAKFWTGQWPVNRAPAIKPIELLSVDAQAIKPGTTCHATVSARDPDQDALAYEWVVRAESTDRKTGGDHEAIPPAFPELIGQTEGSRVRFKAPADPGAYRLYVFVRDGQGHAATANCPFRVEP